VTISKDPILALHGLWVYKNDKEMKTRKKLFHHVPILIFPNSCSLIPPFFDSLKAALYGASSDGLNPTIPNGQLPAQLTYQHTY